MVGLGYERLPVPWPLKYAVIIRCMATVDATADLEDSIVRASDVYDDVG